MEMDYTVLCYLKKGNQYLFMLRNKEKNDLNEGKWIGIGGHIEVGESKEEALIREVKEETGFSVNSFTYRGEILFINNDYQEIMYVFTSDDFSGEMIECDEGELSWIDKDKILDLNLWEGDRYFLKPLLNSDKMIKFEMIYKDKELVEVKGGVVI